MILGSNSQSVEISQTKCQQALIDKSFEIFNQATKYGILIGVDNN